MTELGPILLVVRQGTLHNLDMWAKYAVYLDLGVQWKYKCMIYFSAFWGHYLQREYKSLTLTLHSILTLQYTISSLAISMNNTECRAEGNLGGVYNHHHHHEPLSP